MTTTIFPFYWEHFRIYQPRNVKIPHFYFKGKVDYPIFFSAFTIFCESWHEISGKLNNLLSNNSSCKT